MPTIPTIAYFSMEIALDPDVPTYSGGLGVLAGDTLRSAADLHVPVVAVTLLYRKGYFQQRLGPDGTQFEDSVVWDPSERLEWTDASATVTVEGKTVHLGAWLYRVRSASGFVVPVILIDSDLPQNDAWDRTLTDQLYGGDSRYRLAQEIVLGLGGLAILESLGYREIRTYHLNEGHSSLLTLGLLEEAQRDSGLSALEARASVRAQCVFTTHTPVPAGHDKFERKLAEKMLGRERAALLDAVDGYHGGTLNMTYLALNCCRYVNGVAMKHGEVSRAMFPEYTIHAITNGVHAVTWASPSFAALFDRRLPEWRGDNLYLRYATSIPLEEIEEAHLLAKRALFARIRERYGIALDEKRLTIGFARRAALYKRAELLFTDIERLRRIAREAGPIQIVYAGKAHPSDIGAKDAIRRVFAAAKKLAGDIPFVYIENHDFAWGRLLTSGVDLWLNTPRYPEEASGTSGMKAALNGVPSLSVRDGWWVEGHIEGITGWSIGGDDPNAGGGTEVEDLYDKLEGSIVPLYYDRALGYARIRRSAIALNGSFFNTQRMVAQYVTNAYTTNGSEAAE
jgi:starch phosphorylase